MKILAAGDSFVWGSELLDHKHGGPDGYSRSTYPAIIADQLGMEYECVAYPGNANNAISRMAIDAMALQKNIFLLATWSYAQRYEFRFGDNWTSINSWHTTEKDFSKQYFKHVGNNEYYEIYTSLKEILYLQQYCEINHIPYMFLTANNHFYQHENYYRSRDTSIDAIYNQIKWDNWFWFPKGIEINETPSPRGFYQWAIENKYKMGIHGHPLEDAHRDAANMIKEKVDELVKKYY